MASQTFPPISNGEAYKQPHTGHTRKSGGKEPYKTNMKNNTKSARSIESTSAGVIGSEDDEPDSSASEEHSSPTEDADVFALSTGRQQSVAGTERLSAGPRDANEDIMMDDDHEDSDDDEQYADVGDISDSEVSDAGDVNESQVRRAAESDLIGEFEREEQKKVHRNDTDAMSSAVHGMAIDDTEAQDIVLAQQMSLQAADPNIDFDFAVNMDDDPFVGLAQDSSIYEDMLGEAEAEIAMWRRPGVGIVSERGATSSGTQKRVRFEEVHDTPSQASSPGSSDEEVDGADAFPDLFASQDDPLIQRHLALDVEDDSGLQPYDWADTESCYDFDGDEERLAFQLDEEEDSDESDDDSDITDSDVEGDTTDEEDIDVQRARVEERRAAAAKLRGTPATPTPARASARATSTPSTPRPTTPGTGRGPVIGTFAKDPTRATITNDAITRKTKIEPPSNPPEKDKAFWENAKRMHLKPGSRRGSCFEIPSPRADNIPNRPFTAKSTLGTMFDGNLDLLRNHGAAELEPAMRPPTLSRTQMSFSGTTVTEDSDDESVDINMQDFIEMDSESEDERPSTSYAESPSESEMYSSSQNNGMPASSPALLNHFELNRGLVGSFRRNQQSTKHFSSLPSHPAKRASTHEYNALQKGRRGAGNAPMTPARKKRASQDLSHISGGVRKGTNSPLASRRPRSRGNSITTKNPAGLYDTLARGTF